MPGCHHSPQRRALFQDELLRAPKLTLSSSLFVSSWLPSALNQLCGDYEREEERRGEERRGEERRGEERSGEERRDEERRGETRRGEERKDEERRDWTDIDSSMSADLFAFRHSLSLPLSHSLSLSLCLSLFLSDTKPRTQDMCQEHWKEVAECGPERQHCTVRTGAGRRRMGCRKYVITSAVKLFKYFIEIKRINVIVNSQLITMNHKIVSILKIP